MNFARVFDLVELKKEEDLIEWSTKDEQVGEISLFKSREKGNNPIMEVEVIMGRGDSPDLLGPARKFYLFGPKFFSPNTKRTFLKSPFNKWAVLGP